MMVQKMNCFFIKIKIDNMEYILNNIINEIPDEKLFKVVEKILLERPELIINIVEHDKRIILDIFKNTNELKINPTLLYYDKFIELIGTKRFLECISKSNYTTMYPLLKNNEYVDKLKKLLSSLSKEDYRKTINKFTINLENKLIDIDNKHNMSIKLKSKNEKSIDEDDIVSYSYSLNSEYDYYETLLEQNKQKLFSNHDEKKFKDIKSNKLKKLISIDPNIKDPSEHGDDICLIIPYITFTSGTLLDIKENLMNNNIYDRKCGMCDKVYDLNCGYIISNRFDDLYPENILTDSMKGFNSYLLYRLIKKGENKLFNKFIKNRITEGCKIDNDRSCIGNIYVDHHIIYLKRCKMNEPKCNRDKLFSYSLYDSIHYNITEYNMFGRINKYDNMISVKNINWDLEIYDEVATIDVSFDIYELPNIVFEKNLNKYVYSYDDMIYFEFEKKILNEMEYELPEKEDIIAYNTGKGKLNPLLPNNEWYIVNPLYKK